MLTKLRGALAMLLLIAAGAGCVAWTRNTITNMTPKLCPRSADGLYTFEARWDSNERAIITESMTPYVVIGNDYFPMQRVAHTTNRWETALPLPAKQRFVNYHFKFDYLKAGFGGRKHPDSKITPNHQLEIVEQ